MSDNREETVEECPGNVLTGLLTTDLGRARISMDRRIGYGRRKQVRPMITDDPGHP